MKCAALAAGLLAVLQLLPTQPPATVDLRSAASSTGWTTYHKDGTHDGYDASAPSFPAGGSPTSMWTTPALDGTLYAEPLVLNGVIYQATENNSIYALDESTGRQLWSWHKYASVSPSPASSVGCGNIDPVGITSTPVIDPSSGLIYAVGLVSVNGADKYQLFTVNLSNGTEAYAPVDIGTNLVTPTYDEQRAAISLAPNGLMVYVAFGGWVGDCTGTSNGITGYHPIVIAIPVGSNRGAIQNAYQPQTGTQLEAGIWGASGVAIDSSGYVYASTGNGSVGSGLPCNNTTWDHGEAVVKLSSTVVETGTWARSDWCLLNANDNDIGSAGPMLLQNGQVFQAGKPGDWDLLSSASLGGIGGQISQGHIDSCPTSGAVFGGYAYAAPFVYVPCDGAGLVALKENTSVTPNTFSVAWQTSAFTPTAPIVAGGVVWTMGSGTLYGFDAATGIQRFSIPIGGHTSFATPSEDSGWVIVPESNTVSAVTFAWSSLGGVIESDPDAASWAAGRVDVFVRGQDQALWHRAWNGTTWLSWESLGGVILNDAGAVSGSTSSIDVVVRGQDNALWHRHFNGTAWSAWESLGGVTYDGPDISSGGATLLDVFVRGQDNALWHRVWNGAVWQPWESLGGVINAAPGAVASTSGSVDVFVRGQDNALWHRHWNGTAWQPWESLGGVLWSGPDASSCAAGKLDVFVRGQDSALWRRSFDGASWGSWVSLGGHWTSGPGAACQPGTTKIDLFERGDDSALWTLELPS